MAEDKLNRRLQESHPLSRVGEIEVLSVQYVHGYRKRADRFYVFTYPNDGMQQEDAVRKFDPGLPWPCNNIAYRTEDGRLLLMYYPSGIGCVYRS